MNLKKAVALALATGMTLSLAACGGGDAKTRVLTGVHYPSDVLAGQC